MADMRISGKRGAGRCLPAPAMGAAVLLLLLALPLLPGLATADDKNQSQPSVPVPPPSRIEQKPPEPKPQVTTPAKAPAQKGAPTAAPSQPPGTPSLPAASGPPVPAQPAGNTQPPPLAPSGGGNAPTNAFKVPPLSGPMPAGFQRFQFKIDPNTPLEDLLPIPPKYKHAAGPMLTGDLTKVPEISFQQPLPKEIAGDKARHLTAHAIAKINHLNQKKTDAFMEALLGKRSDLAGLPFSMGDVCRMSVERSRQFSQALATVRRCLPQQAVSVFLDNVQIFPTPPTSKAPASGQPARPAPVAPAVFPQEKGIGLNPGPVDVVAPPPPRAIVPAPGKPNRGTAELFWEQYQVACLQEDRDDAKKDSPCREHAVQARIAALMQVLAPESANMRKGLVKYLSTISHPEATRALAKLAIFSTEEEVQRAAIDALKVRRERDYTAILLQGLHYPWPDVAKRSADAMVKLERTDLVPKLVDFLEEPDPRLPVVKTVKHKKVPVVRELVRINHHRNCLMCHAPGNTANVSPDVLTAAVPIANEPLPSFPQGYQSSSPDLLIRVDVTYLRQDFSRLQPVADAHPWPDMQRFDFLVRSRVLTADEAQDYQDKLTPREPGALSPYHRAALAALRELTQRDTEPTPEAWRRLLKLTK